MKYYAVISGDGSEVLGVGCSESSAVHNASADGIAVQDIREHCSVLPCTPGLYRRVTAQQPAPFQIVDGKVHLIKGAA